MEVLKVKKDRGKRTDIGVLLECLYEVYEQEGIQILSGKNIYSTMVYSFLRMLVKQCDGTSAEKIHEILWKEYLEISDMTDFVEKAKKVLYPYVLRPEKNEECCCCL